MQAFYATVWFFFLLICPAVTLSLIILSAVSCHTVPQALVRGVVTVVALVLLVGPVWTEIGPMPWWFSGSKLVRFSGVRYLVWQYALVCAALYALVASLALSVHRRVTANSRPTRN